MTESARSRVLGYLELDPTALGLRFGVSRSGCSGWGYKVEVARNALDTDVVFDDAGVRIYVDAASLSQVAVSYTHLDVYKRQPTVVCGVVHAMALPITHKIPPITMPPKITSSEIRAGVASPDSEVSGVLR